MSKFFKAIWDTVEAVTFAGAIFTVCYLFFFQVSEVHGASSYPTLQENERLILDKISYRFTSPNRGDFVIIYSPYDKNVDFVKRIVGLSDETLRISNCAVYINNERLSENYLSDSTCTRGGSFIRENSDFYIPSDSYVVMGDNRPGSSDSRTFGPIKKDDIVGKIQFRIFPFTRF